MLSAHPSIDRVRDRLFILGRSYAAKTPPTIRFGRIVRAKPSKTTQPPSSCSCPPRQNVIIVRSPSPVQAALAFENDPYALGFSRSDFWDRIHLFNRNDLPRVCR